MRPEQFLTRSLQDRRIARILQASIEAVDPALLVARQLRDVVLPTHSRRFLLGLGKAAEAMTGSAAEILGSFDGGLIITKHRSTEADPRMTVLEAGHPIPDHRSLAAGREAIRFVSGLQEDDLLLCLISGGGSALVTSPIAGISLQDLQALTSAALASGAEIQDINVLRRQLDQVKGGGLAAATKASVVSLILSDVIGDRLEAIASGPTAPNPTGSQEALGVLRKYRIRVPATIRTALESPKPSAATPVPGRVRNVIIGNGALALSGAVRQADREGIAALVLETRLQGEAQVVGRAMAVKLVQASRGRKRPFCMLASGETTVTLTGQGVGGRNQELVLAAVDILDGVENCALISLATDGNDGPTDAAGALATGASKSRAASCGMTASDHLARHAAYPFFDALGDLLKPGYTGTNVNDLILLVGL